MADDSSSTVIYDLVIDSSVLLESIVQLEGRWHDANPDLARRNDVPSLEPAGVTASPRANSRGRNADEDGEDQLPRVMKALGQSFEIWTKYTGALADVGLSLDDRLRDHPDIQGMVVDMLTLMKTNLSRLEGQLAGRGKLQHTPKSFERRRKWIDVIQDGDRMDAAAESQAAVAEAMDSLHFIAGAIRRSSAQPLKYALSTKFVRKDELYWEQYATIYVRRFFPDARPGLVRQLGAAIAVRRKRLFGRKRHDEKLASKRSKKTKEASSLDAGKSSPSAANQQDNKDGLAVPTRTGPAFLRTLQPSTVFTQLDQEKAHERLRSRPQLTYVSSVRSDSSATKLQHQYPPAPQFKDTDYHQACPYCARGLETSRLKVPKYWEKHVDEDLEPYVCISEYCSQRLLFFTKKDQWLDHMRSIHSNEWASKVHMRTWYCDVDHDLVQFNDQTDFESHLKDASIHPRAPTDAQLASLVRKKSQLLPREAFSCPFCENIPKDVQSLFEHSPETARYKLHSHIALHVKDLAFISLPMAGEDNEEGAKESVLDEQSSRGRQRRDDSSASLPSGYGDLVGVNLDFEEPSYLKVMAEVQSDVPMSEHTDWSELAPERDSHERNDPIIAHFSSLQHQVGPSKKHENSHGALASMPAFLKFTPKDIEKQWRTLSVHQEERINLGKRKKGKDPTLTLADERHRRELNRYTDIFPWQYNRVRLKMPPGQEDYVNASLINLPYPRKLPDLRVETHQDLYIATQGPLEKTIPDVWRMIVEQTQSPAVIVMLTETHDHESYVATCADYFPLSPSDPKRQLVQGEESGDPFRAELACEELTNLLDGLVEMRRLVIKVLQRPRSWGKEDTQPADEKVEGAEGENSRSKSLGSRAMGRLFGKSKKNELSPMEEGNYREGLGGQLHRVQATDRGSVHTDSAEEHIAAVDARGLPQAPKDGDPGGEKTSADHPDRLAPEETPRTVTVEKNVNEEFVVWHLLYKNGEAFDQPDMEILEALYTIMHLAEEKNLGPFNPRIVHCIAGTGRTGTYIALEHLIREVEAGVLEEYGTNPDSLGEQMEEDLVFRVVRSLRDQRPNMIRNFQQYQFLYQVVGDLWKHKYAQASDGSQAVSPQAASQANPFVFPFPNNPKYTMAAMSRGEV